MSERKTICFVGTTELKDLLDQWAKKDDRSVSYVMRQILEREAQRRRQSQQATAELKPISQHAN